MQVWVLRGTFILLWLIVLIQDLLVCTEMWSSCLGLFGSSMVDEWYELRDLGSSSLWCRLLANKTISLLITLRYEVVRVVECSRTRATWSRSSWTHIRRCECPTWVVPIIGRCWPTNWIIWWIQLQAIFIIIVVFIIINILSLLVYLVVQPNWSWVSTAIVKANRSRIVILRYLICLGFESAVKDGLIILLILLFIGYLAYLFLVNASCSDIFRYTGFILLALENWCNLLSLLLGRV